MRTVSMIRSAILAFVIFSFLSCKKTTEVYQTDAVSDYIPVAVGKSITYRLDSTVFTNFGTTTEVHSYELKHVIESQIVDNLGRPSYRVFKYLRDTAGTQPWVPAGSYFITPLSNQIEVIEDNLRFIKLHAPVVKDYKWKGNSYLSFEPYSSLYVFENDDDMDTWDYTYKSINDVFNYKQQTLSNVLNVLQVDDRTPLDTLDVINNRVTIPKNSGAAWVRGSATDTIIITANAPDLGHEDLTVYNQSGKYAKFNGIKIPPGFSLYFQYKNNQWYYPNPVTVRSDNKAILPSGAFIAYIFNPTSGHPTSAVTIDVSNIDTNQTKKLTIYNKSDSNAVLNNIIIPPGYGRNYELRNGQWTYYNGINVLLDTDPYSNELPLGYTTYSVEKYAKNVGLVFKELIMWEYQPNSGAKKGFGIKMSMIDHN